MSQIMAFTQRIEFKTLLEVECKGVGGFKPVVHSILDEFTSMLSLFEKVDILIIDEPDDEDTFLSLLKAITYHNELFHRIFLLSEKKPTLSNTRIFPKNEIESLIRELKNVLGFKVPPQEVYMSVPMDTLIHFKMLPFDLYVKIADDKFVKRIPANEEIDETTFNSFFNKGIRDLYFDRQYNRDFSRLLINNMINKVEKDYQSIDQKLTATNDVFLTTHQIVGKLGFKPLVINVCESVINQISEDVVKGKDNFSKFLEQLRHQKELSFQYRLVELTSFIGTQMIEDMEKDWKNEKIRKLVFASMFCDYTLKSEGQLHIRHQDQVAKLKMGEQKEVQEHAMRAAELVSKYVNAPVEASTIIKQSHGTLNGVGFPDEISPKILPLSKCLMAAQEISYQILTEAHRHPIDVLSDVKLKFIDTTLEEHFNVFENTCIHNLKIGQS